MHAAEHDRGQRGHWLWWGGFLVLAPLHVAGGCLLDPSGPSARAEATPPGGQASPEPQPAEIRVATYNVHNLFNDRVDGPNVGGEEIRYTPSAAAYERKLARLADALGELRADVVVLQEVENQSTLEQLADQAPLRGRYPNALLVEGNDLRGIDVGVLSRLRVDRHRTHRNDRFSLVDSTGGESYRYARDCLEVHLMAGDRRLIVLAVHFKSHRDDDPDHRLAEAQHTRLIADRLAEQHADAAVVIAGDFNDPPGSDTLAALGAVPGYDAPAAVGYASVGAWLRSEEQWTTVDPATGRGTLFDDLLVSPALYDALDIGSVRALHETLASGPAGSVSDHAPLVAAFRLDPAGEGP